MTLFGALATDANFSGANLRGADLELTVFEGADLSDAVLEGAMVSLVTEWKRSRREKASKGVDRTKRSGGRQTAHPIASSPHRPAPPCPLSMLPAAAATVAPCPPQLTNAQFGRVKSIKGADFTDVLIRKDVQRSLCKIAGGNAASTQLLLVEASGVLVGWLAGGLAGSAGSAAAGWPLFLPKCALLTRTAPMPLPCRRRQPGDWRLHQGEPVLPLKRHALAWRRRRRQPAGVGEERSECGS